MRLVQAFTKAETELIGVTGPDHDRQQNLLIENNGWLYLVVKPGDKFGIILTNLANHMVAYPVFTSLDGQPVCNLFIANPEMDPNRLASNGGMMEAGELGSRSHDGCHDAVAIDRFRLPGDLRQLFVATDNGSIGGLVTANQLLIYRRTRPGVVIAQVLDQSLTSRMAAPTGPHIGAAEIMPDGRRLTGLDYLPDAGEPIFRVQIIYPERANKILERAGMTPPASWTIGQYY